MVIKKRGAVLGCGGTIASRGSTNLKPELSIEEIIDDLRRSRDPLINLGNMIKEYNGLRAENATRGLCKDPTISWKGSIDLIIDPYQLFGNKGIDSSDMSLSDRLGVIAEKSYEKLTEGYDFVVITHGTDTMAMTLAVLTFALRGLKKPVIVTGSNRPWDEHGTDAKRNLSKALLTGTLDIHGTYGTFDNNIIAGPRCKKAHFPEKLRDDIFETVNFPLCGILNFRTRHYQSPYTTDWLFSPFTNPSTIFVQEGPFELHNKFEEDIMKIDLDDSAERNFRRICRDPPRGLVIGVYGEGGVPNYLEPYIKELYESGIPLCAYSQARMPVNPDKYEVGNLIKKYMIPLLDMHPEVAHAKLMYALGKTRDLEEIRKIMLKNLDGEISTTQLRTCAGEALEKFPDRWKELDNAMRRRGAINEFIRVYGRCVSGDFWPMDFPYKCDEALCDQLWYALDLRGPPRRHWN